MMVKDIASLYERDLNKVIDEILLYKTEDHLWEIKEGISNPGGNLALHLAGGLQHFIGATLGKTGYVRDRDAEFAAKYIPRAKIIEALKIASETIGHQLSSMSEQDLEKDFPIAINNTVSPIGFVLLFFLTHLNYHLGQINYHRRLSS
jgi:Protein of unknown function (DUF1572)